MGRKKITDSGDSIEEMIALWQDSRAQTPLLYVEGKDDVLIYREILLLSGIERERFTCIPAKGAAAGTLGEGRSAVYSLFEMYQANQETISRPILFFADKDLYVFGQVPEAYAGIYFTHGYSIENDLFCDGEPLLMTKLRTEERERFAALLDSVCAWFGHAKNQQPPRIDENLRNEERIAPGTSALRADFVAERGCLTADDARYAFLRTNFNTHLRGKFFFEVLWRIMLDRESETLRITHEHPLWLDCIAEGLRHEGSHCRRIAAVIRRALPAKAASPPQITILTPMCTVRLGDRKGLPMTHPYVLASSSREGCCQRFTKNIQIYSPQGDFWAVATKGLR